MTPRNLPLLCLALLLTGCAAAGSRVQTAHAAVPAPPASGFSSPDEAVTYHVFMGELAQGRKDPKDAIAEYRAAAELSRDASLSAHAALLAYESGDLATASELARRWQSLAPDSVDAIHLVGVLDARRGDAEAAAQAFESLLGSHAEISYMPAARLLEQETDPEHGLPVLQAIVTANPKSADAHFALAHAAMEFKRYDLAEREARAAMALDPKAKEPLVMLARALTAEGKADDALSMLAARAHAAGDDVELALAYAALLEEAHHEVESRKEFQDILTAHPDNADALYTLGLMLLQEKDLPRARSEFTRLLKTGKRPDDASYFLGSIAETEKHYPDALVWYRRVEDGERWLPAQAGIGRTLVESGAPTAAAEFFDDLVADDPEAAVALRLAEGQVFSDAGDSKRALGIYNAALASSPGDQDLLYARALVLEQDGDASAAEKDLTALVKRQPDDAVALNALGYTLTLHTNRYAEARDYIQRALVLQPGDPAIMDSMGWVEYRMGDASLALQYLQKAYASQPDPEIAAHLVEVLLATGDKDGAHALWTKAMAASPDSAPLKSLAPRFNP
ncbi:MAG TPA: tetratricopeptide repeat protein [Gammaproteobacteria bacterium]|nr:tetratricopeptide repeat protein [Gammaproteobacteria bacterium]